MTYSLNNENGFITIADQNGVIVDQGFYDNEGSNDFWMKSGIYEQMADILSYWNQ